jgi:serine/threonine protein kinase
MHGLQSVSDVTEPQIVSEILDFLSWSLDIVRALDHLHNRNPIIMHRDLKPGESALQQSSYKISIFCRSVIALLHG